MKARYVFLLLVGCQDTNLARNTGALVFEPAPGTALVWPEQVLGRAAPPPAPIVVRNVGSAAVSMDGHRVEGEGAQSIRITGYPSQVGPGQQKKFSVRYEPQAPGPLDATLVVLTGDPAQPEVRYPLGARARPTCALSPWPTYQRFQVGSTAQIALLANSGADCVVERVTVDTALFELVDLSLPLRIPAGEERSITVRHHRRTESEGIPLRTLKLYEADGAVVDVSLEGAFPLWACLTHWPSVYEFERTILGFTRTASITVMNRCAEPAELTSAGVSIGTHAFVVDRSQFPLQVPAQGAIYVPVTYVPAFEEGDVGRLNLITNDAVYPRLRVELSGKAIYSQIRSVGRLDLGIAALGCASRSAVVPIWSNGEGPLRIYNLRLDGPDAAAFLLEAVLLDGRPMPLQNIVIPAGQRADVVLRFVPRRDTPAPHQATLVIEHAARGGPVQVALSALAAPGGLIEDEFEIRSMPSDVLFVIDSSRSMAEEQERLVLAAGDFLAVAEASGASFHVAVTPMADTPTAGQLFSCNRESALIRSTDATAADRVRRLSCNVRAGRRSVAPQRGLWVGQRVVERALDLNTNTAAARLNRAFLRPEARLALVMISDEEDTSPGPAGGYADYWLAVKQFPHLRQIHALVGAPGMTCPDDPVLQAAPRYWSLGLAHGSAHELCQTSYGAALASIAATIFEPSRVYPLSQVPDRVSLSVALDGTPAAFRYDGLYNTVNLEETPPLGQTLRIRYNAVCFP